MLNDRAAYNSLYRIGLAVELDRRGIRVRSMGLFDTKFSAVRVLLWLLVNPRFWIVASNLRTNLLVMCLPWIRGLVILNGMGRHRASPAFRSALLRLVRLNRRKRIAVQSYADYRYLRRHAPLASLIWVPGSGGQIRRVGPRQGLVVVQREGKLPLVAEDIRQLLRMLGPDVRLSVVGCRNESFVAEVFAGVEAQVESVGYVDQSELFVSGDHFVQPSGYGEGFPHSLADAIASGMPIYINRREYLRYGLWKMNASQRAISPEWLALVPGKEMREATSGDAVHPAYVRALLDQTPGLQ